jgi:acyl-[acyl-carrier-protein]-phospholipid O-acyltransferase/long-chain-fatty-acid--[acyl-carrier-protein] ligase
MPSLFSVSGFAPYITVIFLNAFVDLGHKIIIQNTLFKSYDGDTQILLTAIVNALILLPFILMFTPSGYLADRWPKNWVMRISAWFAVGITLTITLCYSLGWFWPAFAMTFLLAVQSAFYSPAKFGYIKELVGNESLTNANGWVQAVTMVAILAGTFAFSVLFEWMLAGQSWDNPGEVMRLIAPAGGLLVLGSLTELYMAYRIPQRREPADGMRFDWHQYRSGRYLKHNLLAAWDNQVIWLSIVGLAVFWGISQVMIATYPAYAKDAIGIDNTVILQGILACTGIGTMIGALIAGRLSPDHVETGLIPVGAIGIALGLFLLPMLGSPLTHALTFFMLGVLAAFFIVPLNALIQFNAGENALGRVLAAKNFILNVVMLGGLGLTVVSALAESGAYAIMIALALVASGGAVYTISQLPQWLVRFLIARLFASQYRLQVLGLENLPAQGGVLMLGNHTSWIDWAMVQLATPRPVRFVMAREIYERWYLRHFLNFFGVVPISRGRSKHALAKVTELLNDGEVVCLFPEGTLSKNGQLAEFKRGYELAAEHADGVIVPFYLRGLWGSRFSNASARLKEGRREPGTRHVIVAFGPVLPIQARAERVKQAVQELSVSSWERHVETLPCLQEAWLKAAKRRPALAAGIDADGTTLTNRRLIAAVLLFARRIARLSPQPRVGILLPASNAGAIANLATLLTGRTVVNLNYTADPAALRSAVANAGIGHIITARRFLTKLRQRGIDAEAIFAGTTLHPMEEMRAKIGKAEGLFMLLLAALLPASWLLALFSQRTKPSDTAAILFSSGSEGAPKGIELSHRNIMANVRQIFDVLNTEDGDRVLANLPLFHAFGLTVTTFMPLLEGLPMICHPDPTDAVGSAKAIARWRCTILCSTSTFLRLYIRNRKVLPIMLEPLRIVVAGAERLSPDVRDGFSAKFQKPIFEGYGATETTPVASVNLPDGLDTNNWKLQVGSRAGTVGMPLPGTSFRIVDPATLEELPRGEDGLILIGGVQVMKGYLNAADKTAAAIVELGGTRWYKTGDKGHLDEDGFLTIVDRYSRFAKLGGEMLSLSAVEDAVRDALQTPELELVAVNLPDAKKGERIVLLIQAEQNPADVRQALLDAGTSPLMIPSEIRPVAQVPKLGSGKTDFAAAKRLALASAD